MAAPTERVFVATPISAAGGRIIASPFQFWTTGEDHLRVVSVNSLAGVVLKVQGRFLDAAGVISASGWDHLPTSDRTIVTTTYPLGVGAVLNLTVFARTGSPRIGQTFVLVQLVRGLGAAAIVLGTLLQGYVTSTQALGWPGSPIQSSLEGGGLVRTVLGTVPAVGAEIFESVPTGARWHLLMAQMQFTASAAAATRHPRLVWSSGAQQVGTSSNVSDVTASQQGVFNWSMGQTLSAPVSAGVNVAGLCHDLQLLAGDFIATITSGLQAGDQWTSPRFTVREWLEVS